MLNGIEAIKHNYSSNECKRVVISISKDMKTLYYDNLEEDRNRLKDFFYRPKYDLTRINGICFGAISTTFHRKQKKVLQELKKRAKLAHLGNHEVHTSNDEEYWQSMLSNGNDERHASAKYYPRHKDFILGK